ncbi:hypothetical protein K435DRAFT_600717, partial [Dendrothele bispora CBS 962.96]
YQPFSSSVHWKIAHWAITEKISQRAINRLLAIPEVKDTLGLQYKSAQSMLDMVDQIPDRCGVWKTTSIHFPGKESESFLIHHRDPIEAIKSLWGDPSLADHIVYKPSRVF